MKAHKLFGSSRLILIVLLLVGGLTASAVTYADSILFPFGLVSEGSLFSGFSRSGPTTVPTVDGPTVSTDKADYSPGEIVQISGSGFAGSEKVTLQVVHVEDSALKATSESLNPYDHAGHDPWQVDVASDGSFASSWLVQENSLGQTLRLTADQSASASHTAIHAEVIFTDANQPVDFRQCANNSGNTPVLGECVWINSIVQSSNARYFEGMSNMQRILFTAIADTPGDAHTMTLSHQSTKGGIHAYDFLTSYEQAIKAGDDADVPYTDTTDYTRIDVADNTKDEALSINLTLTTARACGENIGPPGTLGATCTSVRDSGVRANVDLPDDPYIDTNDGSTLQRIQAYEAVYGNRYLRIYADAPVTNATMTITGRTGGGDTADSDINYLLSWTSTASTVLVEVAGHLSVTGTDNLGINWGPGQGSSQISGGPYHFNLKFLDDTSLGAQDNQIKGADILLPGGSITIHKDANPNDAQDFAFTTTGTGLSNFSLDDDADPTLDSSITFSGLNAGPYSVAETLSGLGSWTLDNISCTPTTGSSATPNVLGGSVAINLASGGHVDCTFFNSNPDLLNGRIIVVKQTTPDGDPQEFTFTPSYNGGTTFNLSDGESNDSCGAANPNCLPKNIYTVAETVPADWELTSATCTSSLGDAPSLPSAIDLRETEVVTCTFNNTKKPKLTVNKVTVPADDDGLFNLQIDGVTAGTGADVGNGGTTGAQFVSIGSHTAGETAGTGTSLSDYTSVISGDCAADGSVTLAAGDNKTCTITNSRLPRLRLIKATVPTTDDGKFDLLDGAVVMADEVGNGGDSGFFNTTIGSHTVSELIGETSPSALEDYASKVECNSSKGSANPGTSHTFSLTYGDLVTCTFTNSRLPRLKLIKVTVPADDPGKFDLRDGGVVKADEVGNGGTSGFFNTTTGSHTVDEVIGGTSPTVLADYSSRVECDSSKGSADPGTSHTFDLAFGDLVTCTFTNSKPAAQIDLDPLEATNEVNDPHTITALVRQDDQIAAPGGDNFDGLGPAPDGTLVTFSLLNNTAGADFVGGVDTCLTTAGECSVEINTSTAGGVEIHATTTFLVGGVSFTRETGSGGSNSSNAHKTYVDAKIGLDPLTATNEVNDPHTITATVEQDDGIAAPGGDNVDGFGPAPDGTTVTFSLLNNTAGAAFVGADTCVTLAGECSVQINTSTAGGVDIHATSTFLVGGVSLTRETGSGGSNSSNAHKTYVDAKIGLDPLTATNEVNDAHTITATVEQDDGIAAPAGDNVDGFGPAPDGTTVTFSLLNNTAGAAFVGADTCVTLAGECPVQINTSTAGGVDIHATSTFLVGGVSLTRETGSGGLNSADAHKTYVDAQIDLDPLTATNDVNDPHTITALVRQDDGIAAPAGDNVDGFGPAPDGTTVTFSLLNNTANAAFVGGNSCLTTAGECTVQINTSTPGSVDIHATTTFLVGGESLTRATGTGGLNSDDANKIYVASVLRIRKVVVPDEGSTSFNFSPTGGWNAGVDFGLTRNQTKSSGFIAPGTYGADEDVAAGYVLTDRACVLTDTATVKAFTPTTDGVSVELAAGEDVTCTFTNSKLPTLIVRKIVVGGSEKFSFTVDGVPTAPPNPDITLTPPADGEDESDSQVIQPGDYTVTEVNIPDGWLLTDASCVSDQGGFVTDNLGLPAVTFTAGYGDDVVCSFIDNQQGGATRTQGFWSTHTILTNTFWMGGKLPDGTSGNLGDWVPVIESEDAFLCKTPLEVPPDGVPITAIAEPGMNEVLGGFWSNVAKKSTNKKRNNLDHARMQFLQQYLAAVLNVHAFGTPIGTTTLAKARAAYCDNDAGAILAQKNLLAAYNESGDSVEFTPGANATAKLSREQANIKFWDITYR